MTASLPLPDDVLARRGQLPLKPQAVTLEGRYVHLKPLDLARDVDALFTVCNGQPIASGSRSVDAYDPDQRIWRYMFSGPFSDARALHDFLAPQVNAANGLALCVFDTETGRQIGVANYMSNVPDHLKIELGSIWYGPLTQGTFANTEATYLMLDHAFQLGYRRLEWKCDALNERSRRAALRMGFTFEGIQAFHMIVKGRNRDTAWFRILDYEWPDVKARLEEFLYPS